MEQELTKRGTPRKRKPKQKIYYFTKDTESAILEYVALKDQKMRNKLYKDKIDYAFFKLSQNIINRYKFPYMEGTIEDKQQEVIFHLLKGLDKYDQSKGAAYSYFGTAALRYCILENDRSYKKIKMIDNQIQLDNINDEIFDNDEIEFDDTSSYVLDKFINFIEKNINKIFIKNINNKSEKTKLQELENIKTCYAILEIFKQKENIDIFNKKAILLYIREQTDQSTQQITQISKKLYNYYNELNQQYLQYGYI
jgi:hypothetical protein